MKNEAPISDHDGMGQQHPGGQGILSSRRDSPPELETEQQQGEPGVPFRRRNSSPEPTNKISLAFSNYAHVEIFRTGIGKNRNYEFEYWGTNYIWLRRRGDSQSGTAASDSLCKSCSRDITLAHIKVQESDEHDIRAGHSAGGWIPRALMRITDEEVINPKTGTNDLPE